RELTELAQRVVDLIGVADRSAWIEALQQQLDLGDRVAVEELTQLGVAKELAQLRVVEGQSLSPSLGPGLIVVVEKAADPREHQRRRKGRGRLALDLAHADPAIGDLAEQLAQARQIKGVAQA